MGRFEAKEDVKGQVPIPVEIVAKKKGLFHLREIFGKHNGPPIDIDAAIVGTVVRRHAPDRIEDDP